MKKYPHPFEKIWTNTENDLYWVTGCDTRWIDPVESLTVKWTGDPGEEIGCDATALLVVRMPSEVVGFKNGHGLLVIRNLCRQRGSGEYNQDDVRMRLTDCAVVDKILDSIFTTSPSQEALVGVALRLKGTLRFW